ncbi:MAG: ABC transporter permease [Deltaproteobacteria bacterium]|uniref:ABC transporter permease n=1 Tax=Candidatus Zymogenus saltonus TaxID=2844893 RepID=A0A9D8PKV8_9DELT|nr:ABC transporter permease [Candidatus Zymogenus saltonus]
MLRFLSTVGGWVNEKLAEIGKVTILLLDAARWAFVPPFRFKNILRQMEFVGVKSINIVLFTGVFTGMVLALQGYLSFKLFNAESLVGGTVAVAMAREMGPVISAFMVIARAGSAMAAELGTMRVTEQIDALVSMSINPVKYLVVPRIIAGITMMPILSSIFSLAGFLGSYFAGVKLLGINAGVFMGRVYEILDLEDFTNGIIKSVFFGLLFTLIACYYGFNARGGAAGVGTATNKAVVVSCVTIVISDYFLTAIMFS